MRDLFHGIKLTAPLYFNSHRSAVGVPAQKVDRTDRRRVLTPDQFKPLAEDLDTVGN